MKRILFLSILLCLLWMPVHAKDWVITTLSQSTAGVIVQTDSCTGGLLFSYHCENLDVTLGGIAGGVNNGCALGDTTFTANSAATITDASGSVQDGLYYCNAPTSSDWLQADASSNVSKSAGTVILYVRLVTGIQYGGIWVATQDTSNNLGISLATAAADEISLQYKGAGTLKSAATTAANMTLGTWYKITAKWSVAGVNESGTKYLSIDVNDANRVYGTTALTEMANGFGANSLKVGEYNGTAGTSFQIDNIKIYDSWLTTP